MERISAAASLLRELIDGRELPVAVLLSFRINEADLRNIRR
nr:hypothetical protein [uncultured Acetatifactor sp.]